VSYRGPQNTFSVTVTFRTKFLTQL